MKDRDNCRVQISTIVDKPLTFNHWLGERPEGHTWGGQTESNLVAFEVLVIQDGEVLGARQIPVMKKSTPESIQEMIDEEIDELITWEIERHEQTDSNNRD